MPEVCVEAGVKFDPVWIPKKENRRTSDQSRVADVTRANNASSETAVSGRLLS